MLKRVRRTRSLRVATAAVAGVLAVGAVAACGDSSDDSEASGGTDAAETQSVDVLLPAPLGLNWTAFLVAQDKFYPEEGLDVEAQPVDGSSAVTQQLSAGNATYGVAGAASVYIANTEGADLKGIAVLTHDDVARLSVPEDSEIESADELSGGAIGITSAGDGAIPIVQAVLANAGIEEGEYELPIVGKGGPAVANALEKGRIQAYAHGVSDVAGLEIAGDTPLRSIMPPEFTGLPGNVLALTASSLEDPATRETAIKIARGWIEGAEYAAANPEEALAIACEAVPRECQDEATSELAVELATQTTEVLTPDEPGLIEMDKAQALIDAVAEDTSAPIEETLINDYIADINPQG